MSPPVAGLCRIKYQTNSVAVDGQQPSADFSPAVMSVRRLAVRHCCRAVRKAAHTEPGDILVAA